jgi:hypothetical protein
VRLTDVQRSFRRWLWLALADDSWTLRDTRFEVPDDQRPAGYIDVSTPTTTPFARTGIPQGDVQKRVTLTATLYPTTNGSAEETAERASMLADEMDRCITHGVVVPVNGPVPEQALGYPLALPLWNFAGLSLDQAPAPGAVPLTYADVDSVTARPIPDPLDDRRWTVVLELRLSWWTGGRSRWGLDPEPVADDVPPVFEPVTPPYPTNPGPYDP